MVEVPSACCGRVKHDPMIPITSMATYRRIFYITLVCWNYVIVVWIGENYVLCLSGNLADWHKFAGDFPRKLKLSTARGRANLQKTVRVQCSMLWNADCLFHINKISNIKDKSESPLHQPTTKCCCCSRVTMHIEFANCLQQQWIISTLLTLTVHPPSIDLTCWYMCLYC